MSSTLIISDEASWMPQTGTFETTLELIAEEIRALDNALADYLVSPIGGFPYLNLTQLDREQFLLIANAAVRVFRALLEDWTPDLRFPLEIRAFIQLKIILLLDPRAGGIESGTSTIMVNPTSVVQVPKWVYDVILEHLMTWAMAKQNELTSFVMNGIGSERFELSDLDKDQFCAVLKEIESMYWHYGDCVDGRGRISRSVSFLSVFAPYVVKLYEAFKSDKRAPYEDDARSD